MKILFLLSSLEPAGSETYALSLAQAWKNRHEVFWISDRLHYGQKYLSLPISQKAVPGGVKNTFTVAKFIREHQIDIIHSHSRRAHWVAAQAAALTGIPHVTTVHQPPPVHFFSRLFPCLGDHTIAIDEVIVEHLAKYFRRSGKKVSLIRNGIDVPPPPLRGRIEVGGSGSEDVTPHPSLPPQGGKEKKILVLGRLTGGRWKTFLFFLDVLERIGTSLPRTHFKVAGKIPDEHAADLREALAHANSVIAPSTIEAIGWTDDLPALLATADGVIAGGRSALEGLAAEKPVVLLGEGGILGLCTPETWPDSLRTNQADHMSPKEFVPARMELALRELLAAGDRTELGSWGREQVKLHYDRETVARDVEKVYQCLRSPF